MSGDGDEGARAHVPGPLARLVRQPLRIAAVVLLAATALAASGIQSAGAATLQATLDQHWRGAYDILVTPKDAIDPVEGLLPPNSLAGSKTGLTLDDVARVRALDGVDVAAPIGDVLLPGLKSSPITLAVPKRLPGTMVTPQAYRLTTTYSTDDGLGQRVVWSDTRSIVVDETQSDPTGARGGCGTRGAADLLHGFAVDPAAYPALAAYACIGTVSGGNGVTTYDADGSVGFVDDRGHAAYRLQLPASAVGSTRVTLIDPVAEKRLLGDGGSFLDPLIDASPTADTDVASLQAWAQGVGTPFAQDFLDEQARDAHALTTDLPEDVLADLRRLWQANGADYDTWAADQTADAPVVPMLVSTAAPAALSVAIDIRSFGPAYRTTGSARADHPYALPPALVQGGAGTPVGTATADASGTLNPFGPGSGFVLWPGASQTTLGGMTEYGTHRLTVAGKGVTAGYQDGPDGLVLQPSGYSTPILAPGASPLGLDADPLAIGSEASYQSITQTWQAGDVAPLAVPVGSFDPDAAIDRSAVSHVPLGAYDSGAVEVAGGPHAGAQLKPSLTGTGVVGTRTSAIASIDSAAVWNDTTPVDSIRVRVAGISGYTPAAQHRVLDVARAIDGLGLKATIVAGSSLAAKSFDVAGYAFGTADPAGAQTVGDLGTVTQPWAELGAAARVSLAVSGSTYAIAGIGLAAAMLLLGAVQLAGIPARRAQAATMREAGLTRRRIALWYTGEEVPAVVVVALAGVVAVVFGSDVTLAAVVVAAALAAVVVFAAASVVAGSRGVPPARVRHAESRRRGARSVGGFGLRQVRAHGFNAVVEGAAIVVVGIASAALAAVVESGRHEAGDSALALLVLGLQLAPQAALALAGVVSGMLLGWVVRRVDLAARSSQWATLRAAGWTTKHLARAQRAEGLAIGLPAVVVAAAAAAAGALWMQQQPVWLYAAVAAAGAAIAALISFSARRKGYAL